MNTTDAIALQVQRRFDATPERVFDAWLDPAVAGRWLFATPTGTMERVEIDARVGGRYLIAERRGETLVEHRGEYREIDRPRRLVFDFWIGDDDARPSRVEIAIAPQPGGCELVLTHHIPAERADNAPRTQAGWTTMLGTLAARLTD